MALQLFKIASTTLSAPSNSVDFTSIPQGYSDLLLKATARTDTGAPGAIVRFNGATTNYSFRDIESDGATPGSYNGTSYILCGVANPASATTNTFSSFEFYIPNYTSSNYKSMSGDSVTENNGTTAYTGMYANLWSNTSAINQVTFICGTGTANFLANSTFTLYGVL